MKKLFFLTVVCFTINQIASSQITNTFPLDDSVGIGTTTPTELLQVNGNIKVGSRLLNGTFYYSYGYNNLTLNTTGSHNAALGDDVLSNNTTGSYNTAYGLSVLNQNVSGSNNVAIGLQSMLSNVGGSFNVAVGQGSLISGMIGNNNTAIGNYSMPNCFKGSYNTAIGNENMFNTTKGNYNTSLGALAMTTNIFGSNNTIVGYDAETSSPNLTNASAFGNGALVDASNKVRIGNASVTSNGGQVSWTAYSDSRIKNNILENVPGLEFINLLKPVTYHFDVDKQNEIMGMRNAEQVEGMYEIEKIQYTGFLAQEVDAAAQQVNYDFSGVDKSGEIMGLRYAEFVVPLVKAVQELDTKNEELRMENEELKMQNKELQKQISESKIIETDFEKRLAKLEKNITKKGTVEEDATTDNYTTYKATLSGDKAKLYQNMPNPFSGKTIVQYYIPENTRTASIQITTASGAVLKKIDIANGNGQIELETNNLPSGTYMYSLIIDERIVETKTMLLQQ